MRRVAILAGSGALLTGLVLACGDDDQVSSPRWASALSACAATHRLLGQGQRRGNPLARSNARAPRRGGGRPTSLAQGPNAARLSRPRTDGDRALASCRLVVGSADRSTW